MAVLKLVKQIAHITYLLTKHHNMIIKHFAENAGMEATELSFSLSTELGVCAGNTLYMAGKKAARSCCEVPLFVPVVSGK